MRRKHWRFLMRRKRQWSREGTLRYQGGLLVRTILVSIIGTPKVVIPRFLSPTVGATIAVLRIAIIPYVGFPSIVLSAATLGIVAGAFVIVANAIGVFALARAVVAAAFGVVALAPGTARCMCRRFTFSYSFSQVFLVSDIDNRICPHVVVLICEILVFVLR